MFTLRERLRYAFDNTLSRGTIALIAWLAIISAVGILLIAAVVVVVGTGPEGDDHYNFAEAAWGNLMRSLDAGNLAGDTGWLFRGLMFVVTILGIFILSTLVGVLSNGLEASIEELRKGRSRVVESDHTVILGWSDQIFPILTELIEANASRSGACIVVLGDKDKVEMEDAIRDRIDDTRGTRIICRTGSPTELVDLRIASIDTARSIIVVAGEHDGQMSEDPDVDVIKALLAITNNPARKQGTYHVVAEIRDPKNLEVAAMVGKGEVELVLVGDLIARIMAQTCRQSGLSVVYTELLDFGGDEIYFKDEPALVGKTYGEALFAYEKCALIGLRRADGKPELNPKPDTPIKAGDKVIVVAEDDSAIKLGSFGKGGGAQPDATLVSLGKGPQQHPEKTLLLGWNWRAPHVINELDNYVTPGSTVLVVANNDAAEDTLAADCSGLKRQTLSFQLGDTTDRRVIDALDVTSFDHIIVLCYDDRDPTKADSTTLITLLHLRDVAEKNEKRISIVSEMLDMKNRQLAEVTHADDFIVSDRLVSLMLSQISENKELNTVFKDLFSSEGSEIYLKPASQFVQEGKPMSYATVVEAARQKNASALGYKLAQHSADPQQAYGVVVNPAKSTSVTFGPQDKIIVLAED